MVSKMTPFERLYAAVNFEEYDRPPFADNEWNETLAEMVPRLAGWDIFAQAVTEQPAAIAEYLDAAAVVYLPAVTPAPCGRPMYWRYPAREMSPPTLPHSQQQRTGEGEGPGKGANLEASLTPPVWVSGTAIGRDIVNLPFSLLEQPFELIDLSAGRAVPYQIVTVDDPRAARPYAAYHYALGVTSQLQHKDLLVDPAHQKTLIFVAENVPPLGYKTYRIVSAARHEDVVLSGNDGQPLTYGGC